MHQIALQILRHEIFHIMYFCSAYFSLGTKNKPTKLLEIFIVLSTITPYYLCTLIKELSNPQYGQTIELLFFLLCRCEIYYF